MITENQIKEKLIKIINEVNSLDDVKYERDGAGHIQFGDIKYLAFGGGKPVILYKDKQVLQHSDLIYAVHKSMVYKMNELVHKDFLIKSQEIYTEIMEI